MPVPSNPLPKSLPTLHVYRHILREVSYLPPAFRESIASMIRRRFHQHRKHVAHVKGRIARAVNTLRTLRAANSGEILAMTGLLDKGFGRTGNRRRGLVSQFVRPQGPNDSKALGELLDKGKEDPPETSEPAGEDTAPQTKKGRNTFYDDWDQARLYKFMTSQSKQNRDTKSSANWGNGSFKNQNPDTSVLPVNIWGRPTPENVVRSKRAKWWKLAADKIMPPLGKGEWELLGRLSAGAQQEGEWKVPKRRVRAQALLPEDMEAWDWKSYATTPAHKAERPSSIYDQRRTGQLDVGPYAVHDRRRDISARWFRRAYTRTWQKVPQAEQDPNTLEYKFLWGKTQATLPPPTKLQMAVLESADTTKEKSKRRER